MDNIDSFLLGHDLLVKFLFFFTIHAKMIQIIFLIFNRFNARKYLFACTRTIIFIGHWRNRTKRSCSSFHRITTDRRGSICRQRKRVLVLYLSRFMAFFPFPFFLTIYRFNLIFFEHLVQTKAILIHPVLSFI